MPRTSASHKRGGRHYTLGFPLFPDIHALMETRLLQILVCPVCKSTLRHDRERQELVCAADRLAFPIRDGVPIMLPTEARSLDVAPSE